MKAIITIVVLIVLGAGAYYLFGDQFMNTDAPKEGDTTVALPENERDPIDLPTPTEFPNEEPQAPIEGEEVLGTSIDGNSIVAYHFGTGDTELLLVGGVHGGYSYGTALLGYEFVDYFTENPSAVPEGTRVTVIPVLNPDGLNEVVGSTGRFTSADVPSALSERVPGRFNGNNVDINRNFDCEWQSTGVWQSTEVDGGSAPFSEPESVVIRDYVTRTQPDAAVVYYSEAGGVYASNCNNGVLPGTTELLNTYATASGYAAYEEFDYYEITGDMVNWLAKEGIPGVSVLLTSHGDIEWAKNKAGVDAVLTDLAE